MPKTSVLIPTYNNPKTLKRAIDSCLKQNYKDLEIIITDDSDNNESYELVLQFWGDYENIKYFHNEKQLGSPKMYS